MTVVRKKLMSLLALSLFTLSITACWEKDSAESKMEAAGEQVEQSLEEGADAIESAADEAGEAIEEGAESIKDAAEKAMPE